MTLHAHFLLEQSLRVFIELITHRLELDKYILYKLRN